MRQVPHKMAGFLDYIKAYPWNYFLLDNITQSRAKMIWVTGLSLLTAFVAVVQLNATPRTAIAILLVWIICIAAVVLEAVFYRRSKFSHWLKGNLFNSLSNSVLTLLYFLSVSVILRKIFLWGIVNATFDSEETAPGVRPQDGATWGVLWAARKLILTGRMPVEDNWRVVLAMCIILALWALTFACLRPKFRARLHNALRFATTGWALMPVVLYVLLAGIANNPTYSFSTAFTGSLITMAVYALLWWQKVITFSWKNAALTMGAWLLAYTVWWGIGRSGIFPPINVNSWGGLMLSLIVASCVVVGALPIAILLALGRRSKVYGIPAWITWPVAVGLTLWGLTSTPQLLADSRSPIEQVFAFWPVLIIVAAYFFQRIFKGNLVAGACTGFIELVRSVPLITVLFMGILMAPFFFKSGFSIAKPWPVIIGYILFQAAYMAEVIRGGLQAIPAGQYEAADALGYNSFQKMRFIVMPQALTIVIPALVGQFISAFKSSSLVSIVGLHDLTGIASAIINNPDWLGLHKELYMFLGVVYFTGSFLMSSYSRKLEKRLGVGVR